MNRLQIRGHKFIVYESQYKRSCNDGSSQRKAAGTHKEWRIMTRNEDIKGVGRSYRDVVAGALNGNKMKGRTR